MLYGWLPANNNSLALAITSRLISKKIRNILLVLRTGYYSDISALSTESVLEVHSHLSATIVTTSQVNKQCPTYLTSEREGVPSKVPSRDSPTALRNLNRKHMKLQL